MKPRVFAEWHTEREIWGWLVFLAGKQPVFFERWDAAIVLALYVCRWPKVLPDLEQIV